jgi:hypothetical protein
MSNAKSNYMNVLSVEEYRAADGRTMRNWTKLGVAFPHADGSGFNIELKAFPHDGKLIVLPPQSGDQSPGES